MHIKDLIYKKTITEKNYFTLEYYFVCNYKGQYFTLPVFNAFANFAFKDEIWQLVIDAHKSYNLTNFDLDVFSDFKQLETSVNEWISQNELKLWQYYTNWISFCLSASYIKNLRIFYNHCHDWSFLFQELKVNNHSLVFSHLQEILQNDVTFWQIKQPLWQDKDLQLDYLSQIYFYNKIYYEQDLLKKNYLQILADWQTLIQYQQKKDSV